MIEVLGVSITRGHLLIGAVALTLVIIAWLLVIIQEYITRKIKGVDKRKLAEDIGKAATSTLRSAGELATEYRPAVERSADRFLAWVSPYFSFKGIATRRQFAFSQIVIGSLLALSLWIAAAAGVVETGLVQAVVFLFVFLMLISLVWLLWAYSTKRMRDTGVTAWWVLALLVPPLNLAALVFLLLVPSNEFKGRGL